MKRIILVLSFTIPVATHAESLTSLMQQAIRATSNHIIKAVCDPGGTYKNTPQCYMTPSGKHVLELQEPERSEWMKIATEKMQAQTRLDVQDRNHQRLETQREQARAEENALHCEFWLQQADSDRTFKQIARYCQ